FAVDISLSPLQVGGQTWVAASVRDATEREREQKHTLRAQRLESIGTLAGGVAHDLNNALAPILMVTGVMRMDYPEAQELIETVETSAKRGAAMVRQLLTFAKGVDGERLPIRPLHLLEEVVRIVRGTFPKDVQLETRFASALDSVLGDATQL